MYRFMLILFLTTLLWWGHRLVTEYEPRTTIQVAGMHSIDMTAVTGHDDGGGVRFWRYWIHFIEGSKDYELEVDEESWYKTKVGDSWHYRKHDGTYIFSK